MDEHIYVVDDDPVLLRSVGMLFKREGYAVETFPATESLLTRIPPDACGCLITDLRTPGMFGNDPYQRVQTTHPLLAVVVVTGVVDVATAVRVMESGAVTLLEKPFQPADLMTAVERALAQSRARASRFRCRSQVDQRLATLTEDERQVLDCMLRGLPNKQTATELHVSLRTLDRRRATVLEKMRVKSVPELAALVAGGRGHLRIFESAQ